MQCPTRAFKNSASGKLNRIWAIKANATIFQYPGGGLRLTASKGSNSGNLISLFHPESRMFVLSLMFIRAASNSSQKSTVVSSTAHAQLGDGLCPASSHCPVGVFLEKCLLVWLKHSLGLPPCPQSCSSNGAHWLRQALS
jgi:hypothetical protein